MQQNGKWNQELDPDELMGLALEAAGHISDKDIPEVNRLYHLATHPEEHPITATIKDYIKDKKGHVKESTLESKENKLNAFAKWVGKEESLNNIGKREARKYVIDVIDKMSKPNGEHLSPSTKLGYIRILKAFFEWAGIRGLTPDNPFKRTEAIITKGKKISKIDVRGWKEDEAVRILDKVKAKNDRQLTAMIILAMYTGARGNELAELEVRDITDWSFRIQGDVKNDNSLRNIPIHPKIKDMVGKLKETSTDGYLVSELRRGGRDSKRLHNISKRFGYLKGKLGYKGRSTVFHSYRHTVTTLLHNAGESQERIAGAIGHTDDTNFTLKTYSDELENKEAIKVINNIDYGKDVSSLVAKLTETLSN